MMLKKLRNCLKIKTNRPNKHIEMKNRKVKNEKSLENR